PRNLYQMGNLHVQRIRWIVNLLRDDVLMQTEEGDVHGAVQSCRALLNAARSVGDEPLLPSQLARINGVGTACKAVERVLAQGEPEPADLRELQRLLEEEE